MLYMLHEHAHIIWEVSLAHAEHTHILCTCIYTYVHACMHTYIHTHTHTHTHTHNFLLYVKKNENARVGVADTMKERFSTFFHALPRGAVLGFFFLFFSTVNGTRCSGLYCGVYIDICICIYIYIYIIYVYIYIIYVYVYYIFFYSCIWTRSCGVYIYILFLLLLLYIYIYIKIVCV